MKTTRIAAISVLVLVLALLTGIANADFTFGEPTNLGPTINSPHSDFIGSFSSDGLEMYFDSNRDGGSWDSFDIYVSRRATTDDPWGTPVKLGPPLNSSSSLYDADPIISTDGLSLYFASVNRAGGYGVLDIWLTTRESIDDDWGEPSNLGPTVNTSQDELGASISCDGRVLYFCRKPPPDGPGDIYMSTRPTTNDPWGESVNLGPAVNSSYNDRAPCISPNGLVLFFSSNRPGGFGDRDLYMTRRATIDDDWAIPVNLGPTINTPAYDCFVTILPGGSTLYFTSARPGGVGGADLWQAAISPIVDLNGDGKIGELELGGVVESWHTQAVKYDVAPAPFGDGFVDVQDLLVFSECVSGGVYDPTLAAHWALDEAEGDVAYDSAGLNDALIIGGPQWQPNSGQVNGALELDGGTFVATDHVLNPADGSFSVLAWIQGGAPAQVIISQADGPNWLCVDPMDGSLMTELKGTGRDSCTLCSETTVADGNWHRIALVCDGDARSLYVDDLLAAQDTQAGGPADCSGGLNIGCGKDMAPSSFFTGLIDDVRIYNRAVRP